MTSVTSVIPRARVIPSAARDRFPYSLRRPLFIAATTLAAVACGSDNPTQTVAPGFLGGTSNDHEVGIVVNSTGKAITLFQLGSPTTQKTVAFGASSTISPVGLSTRGRRAAVPLGDAASVALVDLEKQTATRFFTFAAGNATGSAFVDDTTIIAANPTLNIVGRFTTGQSADAIGTLSAKLAPQPTAVVIAGSRALIVSANLDNNFLPIGNGIVTAVDTKTLQVLGTAASGGTNSTDAALGPDGLLYVLNTGDFVAPGSITIINPATMTVVTTVAVGSGPGAIYIDASGLAYVSAFFGGTTVWDTKARTFVRGTSNPLCAKIAAGGCRGAFAATTNAVGDVYQAFFGDSKAGLPPYIFVYKAGTFALTDSISAGVGPAAIAIRTF
jgi:YVTN family beta-propeller protein